MSVSVRFLGTGDAFNARGRCHASYLVNAPSATLLLDCGASALLAMQRDGVDIGSLDAICLSHLHGDHFAGLPFLFIAATFDVPRQRPLTILGPRAPGRGWRTCIAPCTAIWRRSRCPSRSATSRSPAACGP